MFNFLSKTRNPKQNISDLPLHGVPRIDSHDWSTQHLLGLSRSMALGSGTPGFPRLLGHSIYSSALEPQILRSHPILGPPGSAAVSQLQSGVPEFPHPLFYRREPGSLGMERLPWSCGLWKCWIWPWGSVVGESAVEQRESQLQLGPWELTRYSLQSRKLSSPSFQPGSWPCRLSDVELYTLEHQQASSEKLSGFGQKSK